MDNSVASFNNRSRPPRSTQPAAATHKAQYRSICSAPTVEDDDSRNESDGAASTPFLPASLSCGSVCVLVLFSLVLVLVLSLSSSLLLEGVSTLLYFLTWFVVLLCCADTSDDRNDGALPNEDDSVGPEDETPRMGFSDGFVINHLTVARCSRLFVAAERSAREAGHGGGGSVARSLGKSQCVRVLYGFPPRVLCRSSNTRAMIPLDKYGGDPDPAIASWVSGRGDRAEGYYCCRGCTIAKQEVGRLGESANARRDPCGSRRLSFVPWYYMIPCHFLPLHGSLNLYPKNDRGSCWVAFDTYRKP